MPVAPRLTNQQVRTAPLRGVAASPAAFAPETGVLDVATRTFDAVQQMQERERQRADEVVVAQSEVALRRAMTGVLYDPKKGAMLRQGLDAQKAPDDARAAFRSAASDLESKLSTPAQRDAFRLIAQRHEVDMDRQVTSHAGNEFQRVNDETYQALTESELSDITARATDPGWVDGAVSRLRTETARYADRAGWTPEMVERQVETLTSNARSRQVAALVDAGAIDQASNLLTTKSDQFTGEDRAKAQTLVSGAKEQQAVVSTAYRILRTAAGDQSKAEEMLADVPLESRGAVRKYVNAEYDAIDEAQRRKADADYDVAGDKVENGTGRTARERVGETLWQSLSTERRSALDRRMEQRTGAAVANGADASVWRDFYLMPPAEMAKLSRADFDAKYYTRLDPSHQDRALDLYKKAQSDPGAKGPVGAGIMSDQQMLSRMFSEVFQADPEAKASAKAFSDYENQVNVHVLAESNEKGRALGDAEKRRVMLEVARRMTAPRVDPPPVPRPRNRVDIERSAVPGAPDTRVLPYDEIPPDSSNALAARMMQNGVNATRPRIERAYAAQFLGDREALNRELGIRPASDTTYSWMRDWTAAGRTP